MWSNFFNKIYLINLPERRDRYWISTWELAKYKLPFELVKAHKSKDGAAGLYITMQRVFGNALNAGYENILVFEDDAKILQDLDHWMPICLEQLPGDYDLFYLGCNLPTPSKVIRHSPHILQVFRALSTHAVAYSRRAIEKILLLPKRYPIDVVYAEQIQCDGKSYCADPLLVTQHAGYSDIINMEVDWDLVLSQRFIENTKHLQ